VDGSCHGTPTRIGFGEVLRNDSGLFIAGSSGFIPYSDDISLAELSAIYHGITMAKDLGYAEFACYSDSLVCINLINGPIERYHIYVVLIQDIKHLLNQINVTVSHTLREGNQCADFMTKLGVSSDVDLLLHESPPVDLINLLRSDYVGTLFLFLFLFFLFLPFSIVTKKT
jgi:ribonuclease HI